MAAGRKWSRLAHRGGGMMEKEMERQWQRCQGENRQAELQDVGAEPLTVTGTWPRALLADGINLTCSHLWALHGGPANPAGGAFRQPVRC